MLLKPIQYCIALTIISLHATLLCSHLESHIGLMPTEIIDTIISSYTTSEVSESDLISQLNKAPKTDILNDLIKQEITLTDEQINDLRSLSYSNAYNNLNSLLKENQTELRTYAIDPKNFIQYVNNKQFEYPASKNVIPFAKHTFKDEREIVIYIPQNHTYSLSNFFIHVLYDTKTKQQQTIDPQSYKRQEYQGNWPDNMIMNKDYRLMNFIPNPISTSRLSDAHISGSDYPCRNFSIDKNSLQIVVCYIAGYNNFNALKMTSSNPTYREFNKLYIGHRALKLYHSDKMLQKDLKKDQRLLYELTKMRKQLLDDIRQNINASPTSLEAIKDILSNLKDETIFPSNIKGHTEVEKLITKAHRLICFTK